MPAVAQRLGDVQFGLRGGAGENQLRVFFDQCSQLLLSKPVELIISHDGGMIPGYADTLGNGPRGDRVIASDHDDAYSRRAALRDRIGDARSRRIEHRDQPDET